eukprot:CAMPEP_0119031260 /NCGR_PEP_ID=MMETSP1176-20130426/41453_1 /TAXON_ID=265551 /ORGANISM="Synedropsis recta cf, Strain CCMP1620" /LENGTH=328 /DNA_ID=CAMNT_0006987651 /DNA_START=539 /DNA_END=1525 /DNA_ORIENTATION=-
MTPSTAASRPSMKKQSESIRSLLDDAVSPRKKPRLLTRETYLERLQSFSSQTYFAKPIGLSPILCAARGWSNIGADLLECSHCHAKLCVSFDEALLPSQRVKVEQYYKEQLATKGHASELCLFCDIGTNKNKEDATSLQQKEQTIPLYLAAVLDPDFVAWMSHPTPQAMLVERSQQIAVAPTRLQELPQDDAENGDQLLVGQVCDKFLTTNNDDSSTIGDVDKTVLALALLGWTGSSTNDNTTSAASLECKLCLSSLHNQQISTSAASLLKRHKFYCPYRCGITEGDEPCWKTIANKSLESLNEERENDYQSADATLLRIQRLLAQQQ